MTATNTNRTTPTQYLGRGIVSLLVVLATLSPLPASAIHMVGELPYGQKMEHPLDEPVNAALDNKAFLMNLGPTGIRARIDPDQPKAFKVMFVFQDNHSPAKGLISKGDLIIGANGKTFNTPHGFHRKKAFARGWQGPPFELAQAIEDSQGTDGALKLIVLKGVDNSRRTDVTIQLDPVGRFSPTYPWNCPRSDKLLKDLCDFMIENGVTGRHHKQIQQLLALWAADDKRAMDLIEAKAEALMKQRPSHTQQGMVTWGWGYTGIFLGEYYNMTQDKDVMEAVEALVEAYELGQDWRSGGYSHRPFPFIQQRIAGGGPKGYGAMAGPGGLSMLAQSIFKQTGLPYSERAYNRTHLSYLQSVGQGDNPKASIAYGFKGWESVLIRLRTPDSPCKNKKGIGYICPTGMKNIGEFEVEKWTRGSDGWNMELVSPSQYPWLEREADNLSVFKVSHYVKDGSEQRSVVRPPTLKEPSGPYRTEPGGGGHVAPMGMGAVAHFIGNKGNQPWNWLGKHLAAGCAKSPGMLFDGHADATMHAFFSVIGAARADEADFREYLDYVKTLLILAETHDGQGLVEQPFGCQRNGTCSISRDRRQYTHIAILLLSIPKRKLLITGADAFQPAPSASAATSTTSAFKPPWARQPEPPPLRDARVLTDEKRDVLNRALARTLAKLGESGKLRPVGMVLSGTQNPLWLKSVDSDGLFTFQLLDGQQTADIPLSRMKPSDLAALAILVTRLTPESTDAKAMAGVYMEALGKVAEADKLFDEAGDSSRQKLESLFE